MRAVLLLLFDAVRWVVRGTFSRKVRIGRTAIITQIIRVGVRSVFIISLVSASVGLILSLQMAPPLAQLGQQDKLANIIGVAVFRELGPLIGAIVLIGFAGAAITAEIGTMVVGEEIEALEAHALNPVRFLVAPRVIATLLSMTALAVFSDIVAIAASMFISIVTLGLTFSVYWDNMLYQVRFVDFYTGVIYRAMGFPDRMFTVLFALGRLPGWIAHWREMHSDPTLKIGRPRQIYTGYTERAYTALDAR